MNTNRHISNFNPRDDSHRAELSAAAAKTKFHQLERLTFTDGGTLADATSEPAKKQSALLEAFRLWALSR